MADVYRQVASVKIVTKTHSLLWFFIIGNFYVQEKTVGCDRTVLWTVESNDRMATYVGFSYPRAENRETSTD